MDVQGYIFVPDTHGCLLQVERLLARLKQEGWLHGRKLVFLGDYVDRGPDVVGLLDLCIDLREQGHIFLMGNHEFTLLEAIRPGADDRWIEHWFSGYEDRLLAQYGIVRDLAKSPEDRRTVASEFRSTMPPEHLAFLEALPFVFEDNGLIGVHAGLNHALPLRSQMNMLHARRMDPFPFQLFSRDFAADLSFFPDTCVVSGHVWRRNALCSQGRVLLHGGVEYGGSLNAWVSDASCIISV